MPRIIVCGRIGELVNDQTSLSRVLTVSKQPCQTYFTIYWLWDVFSDGFSHWLWFAYYVPTTVPPTAKMVPIAAHSLELANPLNRRRILCATAERDGHIKTARTTSAGRRLRVNRAVFKTEPESARRGLSPANGNC